MSESLGNITDPFDIISGIDTESLHAKLLTGNNNYQAAKPIDVSIIMKAAEGLHG